jgi:chemotaxis protein histidine kinase CheA
MIKPKEPVKRCIDTIKTSLSSWSQESRDFLAKFVRNIEEGDIIYWTQGLCPNHEKSLALGGRGLEGLDRESCPSANFTDKVLKQVAERLRAKMVYSNIRERCIREERDGRDDRNCLPATVEEAERLAEVICVIAEIAHLKEAKFISQNCGGKSITKKLIPKIKKVESSAPTIAFVNENSNHLSLYDYQCNVCFCTGELQKYWIYLDLQNMYVDLKKAVGDESMPFIFDELLNWARQLKMVVDHRTKTPEMMEVLQNEWKAYGRSRIAPLHRAYEIKWLKRKLEMLTKSSDDTTEQKIKLEMEITRLESETLEERTQRKEEEATKKEDARKQKEEEDDRKKEEARKRKEEEATKKEEARQRKEEVRKRKEEARKRKEEAQRKEEAHAENARQ